MPSPRSVGFLCMAFQSNFLLVYIKQHTSVHLIFNDVICKHPSPPHHASPCDMSSAHPLLARATSAFSSSPPSAPCWQPGQGRWPKLSVKPPPPRGNTTDTNYHTAGARPGNRMATTRSNQGTQQQGPKNAKKSKSGVMCALVCAHIHQI